MNIRELSEKTGLTIRSIRYVLDHEVVPQEMFVEEEYLTGPIRTFTEFSAVLIATAASLMNAGMRREQVSAFIVGVGRIEAERRRGQFKYIYRNALASDGEDRIQFGDGKYIRWIYNGRLLAWHHSETGYPATGLSEPTVVVELNFAKLRSLIFANTD